MLYSALGPLGWMTAIMLVAGGAGRLVKRLFPTAPKWLLPWAVLLVGYALALLDMLAGGYPPKTAAAVALGGLFAGGGAIGGHSLLKQALRPLIGDEWTAILLGRLRKALPTPTPPAEPAEPAEPVSDPKPSTGGVVMLVVLAMGLSGCSALGAALQALQAGVAADQGAQWLGSIVDVGETGSERYHDRHPNPEREATVRALVMGSRLAIAAHNAKRAVGAGDSEGTRDAVLDSIEELRGYLVSEGITDARPPDGGAETNAPPPKPFALPTRAELDAVLPD